VQVLRVVLVFFRRVEVETVRAARFERRERVDEGILVAGRDGHLSGLLRGGCIRIFGAHIARFERLFLLLWLKIVGTIPLLLLLLLSVAASLCSPVRAEGRVGAERCVRLDLDRYVGEVGIDGRIGYSRKEEAACKKRDRELTTVPFQRNHGSRTRVDKRNMCLQLTLGLERVGARYFDAVAIGLALVRVGRLQLRRQQLFPHLQRADSKHEWSS
jgi:hypothetical protein